MSSETAEVGRDATLAHHFESHAQQSQAAALGMWAFLVQEVMFFGGLFTVYLVYRTLHPAAFLEGSAHLPVDLGTLNTAVLIGSSLTMALAVREAQLDLPHRGLDAVIRASLHYVNTEEELDRFATLVGRFAGD